MKTRYDASKSLGKCPSHKEIDVIVGKVTCEKCIVQRKVRRNKLKPLGKCSGHPDREVVVGKSWCQKCEDDDKARRNEQRVNGKCLSHSDRDVVPGKRRCQECLDIRKVDFQKNRQKRCAQVKARRLENPEPHRIENRVRREKIKHISPNTVYLNERFEGSEEHHTGVEMDAGFVGVYIPKSMNKGHCAQFGKEKNMDKVNYDALEFLVREIDSDSTLGTSENCVDKLEVN